MDLILFKEILDLTQKYHSFDENGDIKDSYFFDIERHNGKISYKYFISEETKELWIEIYEAINFSELIEGISSDIDFITLKITLYTDHLTIHNQDILNCLLIPFIENIEFVNFERAINHIDLKDINIPHLYSLEFTSDYDYENMYLTISMHHSFKHRLETFIGNLDTWGSLNKLFESHYIDYCSISVLDNTYPPYINGNVQSLTIKSFLPVIEVSDAIAIEDIQNLNIGILKEKGENNGNCRYL